MKLASSVAPVEVSGGSSNSSFSIAMNGKAFRVLSDTLYQNKIGSIVREICCNAYDAHVMVGKEDVPFVVHLPDAFEPWFSVQDFGVGLSPEDIVSVFTVYFQSTKDNANDTIGAFGLGAKTPFSYTDQFTVTSVKDGVRRIYSAYITESGVPSIREMAAGPTTDINGVEIKVSVSRNDYNTFRNEVASQLKFFKVKPVVTNCTGFSFEEFIVNPVINTDNVEVSDAIVSWGQNSIYIIQGNVGYPLDVSQINDAASNANRTFLNTISRSRVVLKFDIGEIGVTASREGVEYNAMTRANIYKKLDVVRAELHDYINTEIADKDTLWGKAEFINSSNFMTRLASSLELTIPGIERNYNGKYYFDFTDVIRSDQRNNDLLYTTGLWTHNKTVRSRTTPVIYPGDRVNIVVVLRDTANRPNIRAKHYLNELGSNYNLMEIEPVVGNKFDDNFIENLTEALGGFNNIKRMSEIQIPNKISGRRTTRVRGSYSRLTYYSYSQHTGSNIRSWDKCYSDLQDLDEAVYVVIKNMQVTGSTDASDIAAYNKLSSIENSLPTLIAIRENDVKKLENVEGSIIRLGDFIKSKRDEYAANRSLYIKWFNSMCVEKSLGNSHYSLGSLCGPLLERLNVECPRSPFTRLINLKKRNSSIDLVTPTGTYDKYAISSFMGWDSNLPSDNHPRRKKLDKIVSDIEKRYPLAVMYGDWGVRRMITDDHLVKYISLM